MKTQQFDMANFFYNSSSFQKAMHFGGSDKHLYDDKNKLNKNFFKEVFSLHYNQPDLKV